MTLDLDALRRQAEANYGPAVYPAYVVLELLDALETSRQAIGIMQRFQPAGSPPPGDVVTLTWWIMKALQERAERADALASQVAALREVLREIVVNGWCPCVGVAKKGLGQ